jgi:hypothetical protein
MVRAGFRERTENGFVHDALAKYGYASSVEHTDGDHVAEIQLGGVSDFPNLWPLNSRVNQQARQQD